MKASPGKGKARDEALPDLSWCDVHGLVDAPARPVVWTKSSVIFTAHPTQPSLVGTVFSNKKRFILPSPKLLYESADSYEPPTVIAVSVGDDRLFAYFPGKGAKDGLGCMWKKDLQRVDLWVAQDQCWRFSPGRGVVQARWIGLQREWTTSEDGSFHRLPSLGPRPLYAFPTLILVCQNRELQVCYFRRQFWLFEVLQVPLGEAVTLTAPSAPAAYTSASSPAAVDDRRLCIKAAIGLSYNDRSILVATRSTVLPRNPPDLVGFGSDPMDPLYIPPSISEFDMITDWELLGEESTIEVTEVHLGMKPLFASVSTKPLNPVLFPAFPISQLIFSPVAPTPASKSEVNAEPTADPTSGEEEAPSPQLYLAVAALDFEQYINPPQTELALFAFAKVPSSNGWSCRRVASRTITDGVLSYLSPAGQHLYAGFIHSHPQPLLSLSEIEGEKLSPQKKTKKRPKRVELGSIVMLRLPDLTNGPTTKLMQESTDGLNWALPFAAAVSPSHALLCLISSSISLASLDTAIHTCPGLSNSAEDTNVEKEVDPGALLLTAVLSRKSTADVVHHLSRTVSLHECVQAIYRALKAIHQDQTEGRGLLGRQDVLVLEVVGTIVEIYKARAGRATGAEKDDLEDRWANAMDLCSLAACNSAFEECMSMNLVDLGASWQLFDLTNWILSFLEAVVREAVVVSTVPNQFLIADADRMDESKDDLFGPPTPATSPDTGPSAVPGAVLFHLVHPYSLRVILTALGHLQAFKAFVDQLKPNAVGTDLAREALVDLINTSGLHLNVVEGVLKELLEESRKTDADQLWLCLASMRPSPTLNALLRKATTKITTPEAVNRARLFVKPTDLAEGLSSLALSVSAFGDESTSESASVSLAKSRDVILKRTLERSNVPGRSSSLPLICTRCGGSAALLPEMLADGNSVTWRTWLKTWARRCVCGGTWTSTV